MPPKGKKGKAKIKTDLSVIVPVHNEERNLLPLHRELSAVLHSLERGSPASGFPERGSLGRSLERSYPEKGNPEKGYLEGRSPGNSWAGGTRKSTGKSWEIIFVDDGSTDRSYALLQHLARQEKNVRVVKLLSNYGQSTALAAGIEHSSGASLLTMDADGQHNPEDIPALLQPLEAGYHVVCGWRRRRDDSWSKTIPSRLANFMVSVMVGWKLHDTIGGMKAFRREVADAVPLYGDMHRYLAVLARWKGFRVTERPIQVRRRRSGRTHYTFRRLFRGFFDLATVKFFISYSTRPFHVFAAAGTASTSLGFLIGFYYLFLKLFYGVHLLQEVASLILSVLLILLGVNFILFGFIADMISFEAITQKKRKMYVVEKVVGK